MEERLRILEMLREGKLSVEEADRLLAALQPERPSAGPRGRLLRVRFEGQRGEEVKFAVPLSLADMVLRYLPKGLRVTVNNQEMDVARLLAEVRDSGTLGKIVDVTDSRGGHVEIIVE